MPCDHDYIAGACQYCGKKQPIFNGSKKVGLSDLSGLKTPLRQPQALKKRVYSQFQYTISEIIEYLGEDDKTFPKYCGIVKRVGMSKAREWIKEMKQRGITSPKYFFGIYKNYNKQQ